MQTFEMFDGAAMSVSEYIALVFCSLRWHSLSQTSKGGQRSAFKVHHECQTFLIIV